MDSIGKNSAVLIVALVVTLLPAVAVAGQLSASIGYQMPKITEVNGFHRFDLPDALVAGNPGDPALPTASVWMLLPPGERAVSVELRGEIWRALPGKYRPEPVSEQRRLSDTSPWTMTPPNPDIYDGNRSFPAQPVSGLTTHLKRGYAIATCLVCPLRWSPTDGSLQYLARAELDIETTPGEREQTGFNRHFRGDRKTYEWVAERVENAQMLGMYPRRDGDIPEAILIVTNEDLTRTAEEYAGWWNSRGRMTYMETVEDLVENEEGDDDQECIRNGVARYYDHLNIGYLILMGDVEAVPHRGLWGNVNNSPDYDIPADLYYAGLDGNWNNDDDRSWGEDNESDLMAEVSVGRLPGVMNREIQRLTHKVQMYTEEPVIEDILTALMLGENLGWQVMGGAYMDEIYEGSNRYGHNTVGFPGRFDRRNLYDVQNGWEWNGAQDLAPLISDGYHMIHHLGHAFTNTCFKLNVNQISNNLIRNDGENAGFNVVCSQGCYAGAFDNRGTEPNQYYDYDCIAEKLVSGIDNGYVAFICNSRYGWGSYNNTNGASQHFQREFTDALFGEDITVIGDAHQDSKEDLSGWVRGNGGIRWVYYELNLLGDPAMDIWTDEPSEFEVDYTGVIVLGSDEFDVNVEGVEDATVCLSRDGEIMGVVLTDEDGLAHFEFENPIGEEGTITLTVTAHNYLTYRAEIETVQPEGGYPWVIDILIDDSEGNGNGEVDAGETIVLNPYIRNIGLATLEQLTITIEVDDPMIRVINNTAVYPDIEAEGEMFADQGLVLSVASYCPDLREIVLNCDIEDGDEAVWSQEINFTIHAPIFSAHLLSVLEGEGGRDGVLHPGEEGEMLLTLTNSGTGDAAGLSAVLDCDHPMVELVDTEASLASLNANETDNFNQAFRVRISNDCPSLDRAVFYVRISGELGYYRTILDEVGIGGAYYTFETDDDEWTHYNIGDDWGDNWRLFEGTNCTPGGTTCIKLGANRNDEDYDSNLNCAIEIPEFHVEESMLLFFHHKMDAEISIQHEGQAYDGGFVEISTDGGDEWDLLQPEEAGGNPGYPYEIRHGSRNPLDEGQEVWSGELDEWTPALFDLADYAGQDVIVRFHFGSDAGTEGTGWWIDDIQLRQKVEVEGPFDLEGEIRGYGAYLTWSTPYVPQRDDDVYPNELLGYRIYRGFGGDLDLLDTLVTDNRYYESLIGMPRGTYTYMVTAEFRDNESWPSNQIPLFWPAAVGDDVEATTPTIWALTGLYPNPFNSLATISYSVPATGHVRLAVYDLIGREVAELADGSRRPGNYRVTFNAEALPSGIYIVRLKTPVGAKVARLVLMR
ncbi:MAG TPA: T9SS type A sorting domain-containing protein [Bacteroidetes bacterium]|nr:T9SS type A sorting domain-containing protein [Bacteroidota bacterium]